MKLSVQDRLTVMNVLFPKGTDFVGVHAMQSIRKKVDFSNDEISKLNIHTEVQVVNGRPSEFLRWDRESVKEVGFDSVEVKFLKENATRLGAEKLLNEQNIELCESILALKE